MAKLSKASDYVVRWRARGHPADWIARQVFGFVSSNWRGWKVEAYQLLPGEIALYALIEAQHAQQRREQDREHQRRQREQYRAREEFSRTAILAAEVCTALGCTKEELSRWKNTRRIPPDGKRGRFHAWLPATVETAMDKVAGWRREDATRGNPCVSVAGLKARGWTDSLLRTFLGEPDKLAANPHYSSAGAPMRLYLLERVEAAERTSAFIERRAKLAAQTARRKATAAINEAADRGMVGEIYKSMLPH
jgi:hypothetical protein